MAKTSCMFCFTCSFRPWADTGDATSATVTAVQAGGGVQRFGAHEDPPGSGHFPVQPSRSFALRKYDESRSSASSARRR